MLFIIRKMASLKPKNSKGKVILGELTKEKFLENIANARSAQGDSIKNFVFDTSRCKIFSEGGLTNPNADGVLYWMNREFRVQDNWSFLYAQLLAMKNNHPLYVCFFCKQSESLFPTKRHVKFLLEGLKCVKNELEELNIKFNLINASPLSIPHLVKKNKIGHVICDFNPLRQVRNWVEALSEALPNNVSFIEVDSRNIVPVFEASNKQESMARTLRPKITSKLSQYLTGFPQACYFNKDSPILKIDDEEFNDIDDAYTAFKYLHDVKEVEWATPGPQAALEVLYSFITERLEYYGNNDPSQNCQSNLSPWIHFGHISAQRIALEVKSVQSLFKEQVEKFLEELIIRKELTDNYCYYQKNYDNLQGAANWAIETLTKHSEDKRQHLYTKEQLENSETYDEIWNAAQYQLVSEGKMHGYMRMYWCKKILEWTEYPEKAIEIALFLNDMYSLDGNDPNGFVGVMWSICGVHDQGWMERPIFGKIRYMVSYSLRRKFSMNNYIAKYSKNAIVPLPKNKKPSGSGIKTKKLKTKK